MKLFWSLDKASVRSFNGKKALAAKDGFQVGQTAKVRSGRRVQSLPRRTWPPENRRLMVVIVSIVVVAIVVVTVVAIAVIVTMRVAPLPVATLFLAI